MVDLENLSPLTLLLAGIGTFVGAILLAIGSGIGADILVAIKVWAQAPTFDLRFILVASLVVISIVTIIFALRAMREQIFGVSAYLFFPKGTALENRTVKFYKNSDFHNYYGLIVNNKTGINPSKAYYLRVKSYAWGVLERQPEIFYAEESNTEGRPDYEKWCADRKFVLVSKVPGRRELLENTSPFDHGKNLDSRLSHVEYRYFISPYDKLKKVTLPPRRIVLNWSTKVAYALDSWTMRLPVEGRIRGQTIMMLKPSLHYAQKWAKRQGFEWSEKLATMDDLLATKSD